MEERNGYLQNTCGPQPANRPERRHRDFGRWCAVKYELDKTSGAMFVDRFLPTAMFYPGNYGFIPHTLSEDGDPCDILVISSNVPLTPGAVIRSHPIGALVMEDDAGGDENIIAVPVNDLNPFYSNVRNYTDLPSIMRKQIPHFFEHYKDLERESG